jgi:threonine dehydratase
LHGDECDASQSRGDEAYGAGPLHGNIWDEANEKAKELVRTEGSARALSFDDAQLIASQGTLG